MNRFLKITSIIAACLLTNNGVLAATEELRDASILDFVVSDLYAGCAVKLDKAVTLPNCEFPNYVHFDCDATFSSTGRESNNKYQLAQMAYALEKKVYIRVSERNSDGICMADTIILQTPK